MIFPRETVKVGDCIAVVCIINGRKTPKGEPILNERYSEIKYQGETWAGHRLSYCLNVEEIPRNPPKNQKTGLVLHHCDNKWCINPEHLYLGTIWDNYRDRNERGDKTLQQASKDFMMSMSPEERSEWARQGLGNKTPEERRQIKIKDWQNRRGKG